MRFSGYKSSKKIRWNKKTFQEKSLGTLGGHEEEAREKRIEVCRALRLGVAEPFGGQKGPDLGGSAPLEGFNGRSCPTLVVTGFRPGEAQAGWLEGGPGGAARRRCCGLAIRQGEE